MSSRENSVYRMALEGLEGPVAAEATNVDAHVCAAGGEGGVVLPVHIQSWSCGIFARILSANVATVGLYCCGEKVSGALPE